MNKYSLCYTNEVLSLTKYHNLSKEDIISKESQWDDNILFHIYEDVNAIDITNLIIDRIRFYEYDTHIHFADITDFPKINYIDCIFPEKEDY